MTGDELAKDHYSHLEKNTSDGVFCRHGDSHGPLPVKQGKRMREISTYFGALSSRQQSECGLIPLLL